METNKEETKNLQISSTTDSLEETLKLSPLFVSMPEDEYEVLKEALKGFC